MSDAQPVVSAQAPVAVPDALRKVRLLQDISLRPIDRPIVTKILGTEFAAIMVPTVYRF